MPETSDHFLLICATCKGEVRAAALCDALAGRLPSGFDMRIVNCMAGCDRPVTAGFQATNKAQYLFGDIQSAADIDALSVFAHQYRHSADGWTSATDRPPALFTKTLARMPRIEQKEPS